MTRTTERRISDLVPNTISDGVLVSRAELISRSLKDISREIRKPQSAWNRLLTDSRGRPLNAFGIGVGITFIGFVLLPVFLSALYLAIFASDQYAAEIRFAVRGGEQRASSDPVSSLMGVSTVRVQDSQIVAQYIKSQGIVEVLEKDIQLRQMFSWPEKADFIFGFNTARPIERLVKYWWWQVDVDIDRLSGIVTVVVRAFTAQDALLIAKSIINASEALVNELSERSRRDALKQAQAELALAERLLQGKIRAMRELRSAEQILDPAKSSDALTKLIGDMRLEVVKMQSDFEAQKQSVSENSPQMRVLAARIRAANDQIKLLEQRMTGSNPDQNPALADSMSKFDRLRIEYEFAQKQYVESAAALERARADVESQQVYLTTFLQPVLAEEALYPKRWWILASILTFCLVLWGAGTGVAVLVRNYSA